MGDANGISAEIIAKKRNLLLSLDKKNPTLLEILGKKEKLSFLPTRVILC